jgi:DNA-binding beta-propeller fold protein YncE
MIISSVSIGLRKATMKTQLNVLSFGVFFMFTTSSSPPVNGPGVPNLSYPPDQVFTVIGRINSENGAPRSHGSVSMHKGYFVVIYSEDGTFSDGGISFYDISNPYSPVLIHQKDDDETQEIREAHGYGYSSSYPGDYVALQAAYGIQIWDWTDIYNPTRLSYLQLPGIEDSDYALGAWWLSWQAPYIYVGGSGNGIYIVDATDPINPVLVDRGADKPNPIPISQTGGFRLGPIFAIGNLLVASSMDGVGYITMDISDPKNPVVLATQSSGVPEIYSSLVNGCKLLGAGNEGFLHVYDIRDPSQIVFVNEVAMGGRGGYLTFQDGFAHIGASTHYAKIDMSNNDVYSVVGTATSGIDNRDEDFATVLGNLVVVSDDHGNGSFFVPHQAEPDNNGPEVNMVVPPDSAVNQALTSRVGITFTDLVDLRTVDNSTFIVRPLGGSPLSGKYSTQSGIVNFFPDAPLHENTIYEIVVPANGIKDLVGNATTTTFISRFSTIPDLNPPLECELVPHSPALVSENIILNARGAGGAGTFKYSWDFGDGTPATPFSTDSSASHIYAQPGHYTVRVTVTDDLGTSHCSGSQTIHYPVSAVLPTSSSPIIWNDDQNLVWNVNPDNATVTAIDAIELTKRFERAVGKEPRTLAQASDGTIWVVNQGDATISVLDHSNGNLMDTIVLPYASRPFGLAFSSDGAAAYVTLQGTGRLLKLNPVAREIVNDIHVGPAPRGIAISGDSGRILVTRFISPADHGEVVEIDASGFNILRRFELALDSGPDTEASGRGVPNYISSLAISPDGRRAWVPSKKDNTVRGYQRDGLPLTFENSVRTIVSQIDLLNNSEDLASRRDLNNRNMAVAVQFSRLGDYAFVATQGSNTIDVFDAYSLNLITSIENVGRAPQGMVLSSDGTKLFVHCFMSRSILVYNVGGIISSSSNNAQKLADISAVSTEKLPALVFEGKRIFFNAKDARMNRDGYISCASCHLDGDDDGRVWDFTDRGEGLRNTISLLGRRGTQQGRVHWTANFDEIQDFEHDIRNAFGGTGFMPDADFNRGTRNQPLGDPKAGISLELDALAAYLESQTEVPPSPYRKADGSLTADGEAGKALFQQLKCATCHAGNDFTDSGSGLMHDVGTIKPSSGQRLGEPLLALDTPTLLGLWQTPPYLHDGSAATLLDVLSAASPGGIHGNPDLSGLSEAQRQQLAAYLLQIDNLEPAAPETTPTVVIISPLSNANFLEGGKVIVAVDAISSMDSITAVEFYVGAVKLGEDDSIPYSFAWAGASPGTYILTARVIYSHGIKTLSAPVTVKIIPLSVAVPSTATPLPSEFALRIYPNPFNISTRIRIALPQQAEINMTVYNLAGREVKELRSGSFSAGQHDVTWDGRSREGNTLSSGIYLLRLRYREASSGNWSQIVRRLMVLK